MIIVTQYTDLHRRAAESDAANYFAANSTATNAYYICFTDGRVERVASNGYWVMRIGNAVAQPSNALILREIEALKNGFKLNLETIEAIFQSQENDGKLKRV